MDKEIKILGVRFDDIAEEKTLEIISKWLKENNSRHIATPNPEFLLEAQVNADFRDILNKTHLNIPDGIGILWAATYINKTAGNKRKFWKILKGLAMLSTLILYPAYCRKVLEKRIAGTDLTQSICEKAAENGYKIFLLGGNPGIAELAAQKLKIRLKNLQIVGTCASHPDEPGITEKINNSGAEILFVAFGAPKQEKWISKNLPLLKNIKIAMGVGGAFDFISGKIKRAPKFMRKIGLEWLFRLIKEPKRIRRIWNAVIKFPMEIFKKH